MSNHSTPTHWLFAVIACAILLSFANSPALSQGGIRAEEVLGPVRIKPPTIRVTSAARGRRALQKQSRPFTYRPDKPFVQTQPAPGMEYAQVGVTIWRLVDASRDLTQVGSETDTPLEQVESTAPLAIGSHMRLGIESLSRDGYLYVIDREQFADGTYGGPSLIFPTLRTRNGDNAVKVNQLVYIPRPPSYFQISSSKTGKTQVAEVITILLSPTPIDLPAPITDKPLALTSNQLRQWEKLWGVDANRLELIDGAGTKVFPRAEREGSKSLDQKVDEAEPLTTGDAPPQTVFRAAIKKGTPLLVNVPLRFSAGMGPR